MQFARLPLTGVPNIADDKLGEANVPADTVGLAIVGVLSCGDVPNTSAPVPVSSTTAARKLPLVGLTKNG